MLSDSGKRLQARKRFAELGQHRQRKQSAKSEQLRLRYAGNGPHNKNQENHRGKQQGLTRS